MAFLSGYGREYRAPLGSEVQGRGVDGVVVGAEWRQNCGFVFIEDLVEIMVLKWHS